MMHSFQLESAVLNFPGNVNEVLLFPDLKVGFPEVKPRTGSHLCGDHHASVSSSSPLGSPGFYCLGTSMLTGDGRTKC